MIRLSKTETRVPIGDTARLLQRLGAPLGVGTYGFVYEVNDNSNEALKIIPVYDSSYNEESPVKQSSNIQREYVIQERLSQLKFGLHLYHRDSRTMVLTEDQNITPKVITPLAIYQMYQPLYDYLVNTLASRQKHRRPFLGVAYAFSTEKVSDFGHVVRRYDRLLMLVSIYQTIEMYQGLIAQDLRINFGHHDLHHGNLAVIDRDGIYSTRLIDFGFSCYRDGDQEFVSSTSHDREIPNMTLEQHAVVDVVQLIASCYQFTRSGFLWQLICESGCLHSCYNGAPNSVIHDDFYILGGRPYRAAKVCRIHETVTLDQLKARIREELSGPRHGVKWIDKIDNESSDEDEEVWEQFVEGALVN
jgi:serine/threonine protein kinase